MGSACHREYAVCAHGQEVGIYSGCLWVFQAQLTGAGLPDWSWSLPTFNIFKLKSQTQILMSPPHLFIGILLSRLHLLLREPQKLNSLPLRVSCS